MRFSGSEDGIIGLNPGLLRLLSTGVSCSSAMTLSNQDFHEVCASDFPIGLFHICLTSWLTPETKS